MPYYPLIKKLLTITIFITFFSDNVFAKTSETKILIGKVSVKKTVKAKNLPNKFSKKNFKIKKTTQPKLASKSGFAEIPPEYFLEIQLKPDICNRLTKTECFRRDKMRDEPYFHKTIVTIFDKKIVAEQFFENEEQVKNSFIPVADGNYQLITSQGNRISFLAKKGEVSSLRIISGSLAKETSMRNNKFSQCIFSEKLYGFYQTYGKEKIIETNDLFEDKNNFDGVKELVVFAEKNNSQKFMALSKDPNFTATAFVDVSLCDSDDLEIYRVKTSNEKNCDLERIKNSDQKINEDLEKGNLSMSSNKNILQNSLFQGFSIFNQKTAQCPEYSDCDDYLIVKNCKVIFLRGSVDLRR